MRSQEIDAKVFLESISCGAEKYFMSLLDGDDICGRENIYSCVEFSYEKEQHIPVGSLGVIDIISKARTCGLGYKKNNIWGTISVRFYHEYKAFDISYYREYLPIALTLNDIDWEEQSAGINVVLSKNILKIKPLETSCIFFAHGVVGERTWT